MPAKGPIVVLGDVINDIAVRPLAKVARNADTPSQITTSPGGSAANLACWLGALGAPTLFLGCAGEADAAYHRDFLARFGVDTELQVSAEDTGAIVLFIDEAGGRTMFTQRGANLQFQAARVSPSAFEGASVFHLSGYSLFEEPLREQALQMLAEARAAGLVISVDPSSASMLETVGASNFIEWTRGAQLLIPNEDEARALTGMDEVGAAAVALGQFYETVIVTLESEGALVVHRRGAPTAVAVQKVVATDSTGAGDAFGAGVLASLREADWGSLTESQVVEAAKVGAQTARIVVTQLGARPAVD